MIVYRTKSGFCYKELKSGKKKRISKEEYLKLSKSKQTKKSSPKQTTSKIYRTKNGYFYKELKNGRKKRISKEEYLKLNKKKKSKGSIKKMSGGAPNDTLVLEKNYHLKYLNPWVGKPILNFYYIHPETGKKIEIELAYHYYENAFKRVKKLKLNRVFDNLKFVYKNDEFFQEVVKRALNKLKRRISMKPLKKGEKSNFFNYRIDCTYYRIDGKPLPPPKDSSRKNNESNGDSSDESSSEHSNNDDSSEHSNNDGSSGSSSSGSSSGSSYSG